MVSERNVITQINQGGGAAARKGADMDESIKNRYMKRFKDHKAAVVLENKDFLNFYSSLYFLGINAMLVDEGDEQMEILLE